MKWGLGTEHWEIPTITLMEEEKLKGENEKKC